MIIKNPESIIPLAKVARIHGLPKQGVCFFKCDLLHVGGQSFENLNSCYWSEDEGKSWSQIDFLSPVKPLGGQLGKAKAIILALDQKWEEKLKKNQWIGIKRKDLPPIKVNEIYLWDLMDAFVVGSIEEKPKYKITGFYENLGSLNLELSHLESKEKVDIPWAWVSLKDSQFSKDRDVICVPNLEAWTQIQEGENDERDD